MPLTDDHLEHEVELDSDAEVLRYLGGRARSRSEVRRSHQERLRLAGAVDGLGLWCGFHRSEDRRAPPPFVGLWMLLPPHGPDQVSVAGEADLGVRLARRWWRQGLASEGCRELLHHGFGVLRLSRIFAQTAAANVASRALLHSLGMSYRAIVGRERDEVEYELHRTSWLDRQAHATGRVTSDGRPWTLRAQGWAE